MLIQPSQSVNTTYYTGAESSTNAVGVNQASARAAIPPVQASGKEQAAQNQLFSTGAGEQWPVKAGSNSDSSTGPAAQAENTDQDALQQSKTETQKQVQQQQQLEDQLLVDQLKARDREVRVHEAAHASVGGQYAGSPNFDYTRGPDGKNYATGGEVSISVSEASDPQATIEKAQVIQAAALAPAQPSAQDRQVAAQAARMALNAQVELQQEKSTAAKDTKQGEKEQADASVEANDTQASTSESAPQSDGAGSRQQRESEPAAGTSSTHSKPVSAYIQQLQQQGPVDPQNPYGKSGQLNLLA